MKKRSYLLMGALISMAAAQLQAAVPPMTSYQGRVQVSGVNFSGQGRFKFALLAKPSGASLWSNDGTSVNGSEPAAAVTVSVSNGLFTVLLGDGSLPNMQPLTAAIFSANANVSLRVWFDDGVNGSVQLSPDTPMASVPYAFSAHVADGSITGAHLASGAIDPAKLASANAPQTGRVLSYDGTGFNWVDLSVAGNNWAVNGTSIYYNAGRVGIGTSTPTSLFDVRGDLTLNAGRDPVLFTGTGASEFNRYLALINSPTHSSASGLKVGGILVADSYGYANPGKNDLIVKGNVGVGTATPATKLTVVSDFYGVEHTDGSVRLSTFLNSSGGWLGTVSNHKLHFYVNDGAPSMTIDTLGNVGIGTSTPTTKLDVGNGNIAYGQLTKLDVADNFVAAIRAADLLLGFSGRRGTPGRALVDFTTDLHVNFAGDWGNTVIGGNTTIIQGDASVRTLTIRGGADVAEPFQMPQEISKGAVVVIDEERVGHLKLSTRAYDIRVAGIVSGANGVNPGIALHQEGVLEGGQNVALSGRVYVQADATYGAIKPGDLLTTSDTPGHAMKVTDHAKAQGAVLGKAMTALADGKGMVLVLVSLQ